MIKEELDKQIYKEVLARYVQKRLTELSEVDEYEPNKLALTNLLWFLGKVTSNEMIVARLKIMIDADLKRKEYLSKFDNALFNDAFLDDEYSKGTSVIGKECLAYLRKTKNNETGRLYQTDGTDCRAERNCR